jgi:hypothetical protein
MHKIVIKGEAAPMADVRFLESLSVEIDGQELVMEDDEGGRNWYNAAGAWVEGPEESTEESDAVDQARMAYWDAYHQARIELGVDELEDRCRKIAAAAVAAGVEVEDPS